MEFLKQFIKTINRPPHPGGDPRQYNIFTRGADEGDAPAAAPLTGAWIEIESEK